MFLRVSIVQRFFDFLLVPLTFASKKFDSEGNLLDDNTKKLLTQLLQNLSNWTRRLREK